MFNDPNPADVLSALNNAHPYEQSPRCSIQNQALCSLVFLYRDILKKEIGEFHNLIRVKKPQKLPMEAVENIDEELKVDPALFGCNRCFGLRVRGDAMIGVNIAGGDIAIIRPQQQVENGEIAAVLVEDLLAEVTLQFVGRTKTALTLKSANPKYRTLVFRWSGRERVTIVGKCVGIVSRV